MPVMPRPWTLPELRRADEMVARGVPVSEVAAALGRSPSAIRSGLYRHGLSDRARRNRADRGARWKAYTLAIRRRAEGVPWRRIHEEAVRACNYPSTIGALRVGTRQYRRALLRP